MTWKHNFVDSFESSFTKIHKFYLFTISSNDILILSVFLSLCLYVFSLSLSPYLPISLSLSLFLSVFLSLCLYVSSLSPYLPISLSLSLSHSPPLSLSCTLHTHKYTHPQTQPLRCWINTHFRMVNRFHRRQKTSLSIWLIQYKQSSFLNDEHYNMLRLLY